MVTLEGIVLWNNQPDREAFGLLRKDVGQNTLLGAVETPYPKVNPILSNPPKKCKVSTLSFSLKKLKYLNFPTVELEQFWYF